MNAMLAAQSGRRDMPVERVIVVLSFFERPDFESASIVNSVFVFALGYYLNHMILVDLDYIHYFEEET